MLYLNVFMRDIDVDVDGDVSVDMRQKAKKNKYGSCNIYQF